MSRRKKKATKKVISKSEPVTFKAFFSKCVNTKKVRPHQEEVIRSFMKDNGLTDKEDLDTYQKMLEKF